MHTMHVSIDQPRQCEFAAAIDPSVTLNETMNFPHDAKLRTYYKNSYTAAMAAVDTWAIYLVCRSIGIAKKPSLFQTRPSDDPHIANIWNKLIVDQLQRGRLPL